MVGFFLIIWALLFGGAPLMILIFDILEGGMFALFSPILLFPIIGFIVFIVGCKMIKKYFKIKDVEKNGIEATGHFISMESNSSVNNVPRYYIKFAFKNYEGREIQTKTASKYVFNEAKYFANKKTFKVKYKGELASIVEEPIMIDSPYLTEEAPSPYIANPTNWKYQDEHVVREKEVYYICEYCGASQKKLGKCKSCGARITEKGKRQI